MLLYCGEALYPLHVNLSRAFVSAPKRAQMRRVVMLCGAHGAHVCHIDAQHRDCRLTCSCLWDSVRSADVPMPKRVAELLVLL